ncbi:GNAT family N-acetyltransferase [Pontibacter rugosus]
MKQVLRVETKRQLKAFIDFPHALYKDDPHYVPELYIAQKDLLTPGKHPFHEHSTLQLYLAYQDGNVVGRIAAILNNNHNTFNNAKDGFFGFFDCVKDGEVANLLFQEVRQWLYAKGAKTVIGPVNFSTNETCGMLVEGFDSSPAAMMPYNYPYYITLLENLGFQKKVDLLAYQFGADGYNDKPYRLSKVIRARLEQKGITIRPISLKNYKQEAEKLREIYNSAWDKNLGFVPMTPKEFDYMAKDLKLIVDPDFCLVAEHEGKIIGFSLAIPDINQILKKIKRGRLLPTGIFKLLTQRKQINAVRIIALGVVEGYRKLGIEAVFYGAAMQKHREKKMQSAEASWILENNVMMNQGLLKMGARPYKKYRIFEKAL